MYNDHSIIPTQSFLEYSTHTRNNSTAVLDRAASVERSWVMGNDRTFYYGYIDLQRQSVSKWYRRIEQDQHTTPMKPVALSNANLHLRRDV
jgi:hypothetical protein